MQVITCTRAIGCDTCGGRYFARADRIFRCSIRAYRSLRSIDYSSKRPVNGFSPNAMDSWLTFQLTLSEVMTLGWRAIRRCILCTLATRHFHHPPTPTKIVPLKITRPAQLAHTSPSVASRAYRNVAARSCWVVAAVPRAAKVPAPGTTRTRSVVTAVNRPVAISRT